MRGNDIRLKLYRGRWAAVWREHGETRRRALRTADRGEAERQLATLIRDLASGRETVAAIVGAFLADREKKPSHARSAGAWQRLAPHFGHLRPQDIGRGACRAYIAMRRRRVADGTIIRELSVLRAALRWHDRNTPALVEVPRQPPPRERYLTRAEYRALREAARLTPHCEVFVVLAYSTAGRAGAVLELTWDRVDLERGLIRLATQDEHGNKGRATVPMTQSCREIVERTKAAAVSDYVVEYGGAGVASVRKAFRAACRRAGLAGVTPHVLRHTAAVHMAESGVPIAEIAQYLGHRDSRTTERVYARFSPDYLRRAATALE